MPKHKPIRFKEAEFPEILKKRLQLFTERHPVAKSAGRVVLALAALGSALTIAAIAPGLIGALGKATLREHRESIE